MIIAIDVLKIIIPVAILTGLALIFGILIAFVSKKLAIKEDVRIGQVEKLLAGANCGACGYAGCADLAKAIVEGRARPDTCPVTTKEKARKIGEIVGETVEGEEEIMIVACAGGNACQDKYSYMGYGDCATVDMLAGGRKACVWGCVGMGKCSIQCAYHAIEVDPKDGYPKIDRSKCVKCGLCAQSCPKKLIKRIPASAPVYVACSNRDRGKDVRSICEKGCIGCGLCAKACENGAITMVDNLPVFDYSKCVGCYKCAEKCPMKAIVKLPSDAIKE